MIVLTLSLTLGQTCDFRTGIPKKLRICDSEMSPRIRGFAICGLLMKSLLAHLWYKHGFIPVLHSLQQCCRSFTFWYCF
jgi:hypothetical protein